MSDESESSNADGVKHRGRDEDVDAIGAVSDDASDGAKDEGWKEADQDNCCEC